MLEWPNRSLTTFTVNHFVKQNVAMAQIVDSRFRKRGCFQQLLESSMAIGELSQIPCSRRTHPTPSYKPIWFPRQHDLQVSLLMLPKSVH